MDYQQRLNQASAYYEAALRRVSETPPPEGPRFKPGARVKIAENIGPFFFGGKTATVKYTYAHAYGSTDERSPQQYCLDIDGIGCVAWYEDCFLSEVPNSN